MSPMNDPFPEWKWCPLCEIPTFSCPHTEFGTGCNGGACDECHDIWMPAVIAWEDQRICPK